MNPLQIILSIIFAILGTILSVFSADIPPPNDGDLHLAEVMVRPEDNAYYSLSNIQMYLYEPKGTPNPLEEHVEGRRWNDRFVRGILYRNEKAIRYFDEAAQRPQFQDPTVAIHEDDSSFDPLFSLRTMARVSSLRAARLFRMGREREALAEAMKIIDSGQKIQDSQGSLIHYLFASDMKRVGLARIRHITRSTTLPPQELLSYVEALEKYKENEEGLKTAFKHQYEYFVWLIEAAATGELQSKDGQVVEPLTKYGFYFKPNKTKSYFADFARLQISNADVPCGFRTGKEIERLTPPSMIRWFITENLGGKILYDIAMPRYAVHEQKCEEDLSVSATQVLLALRAYHMEVAQYPASLDELAPRYLAHVPKDPFDGKPLRYSPQKKMIYSVGTDLRDSGGKEARFKARAGDRVFRIQF